MSIVHMLTMKQRIKQLITANNRVALHLDNSSLWLQLDTVLSEIGAVIVPIPHFFSSQQISHMLESAAVDCVFCENPFKNLYQSFGFKDNTVALNKQVTLLCKNTSEQTQLPEDTHKITFTSGTTGTPKGVCLSRQHLDTVAQSLAEVTRRFQVKKHLSILPLSILLENMAANYAARYHDIEVITPALSEVGLSGSSQLDVFQLIKTIEKYQPNSLILMPQMLKAICAVVESDKKKYDLSSLTFIAVGGAVCPQALLLKAQQLKLPVFEGYGISECGSVISLNTQMKHTGSVGQVLPHQRVKINDDGEILTSGQLFLGYLGDNQTPNTETTQPDKKWYATGDLGRFDEQHNLHIIGRKKNIIINSFGRNISPDWIEAQLLAITEIQQAVIYGEAQATLTAICVSSSSHKDLWQKIQNINVNLPDYAQVKHLIVSSSPFSLQNKMLNASGQYQRANIINYFKQPLQEIYANSQTINP